jgi:hypothetical protein
LSETGGSPPNETDWDSRLGKRLPMVGFCILYSICLSTTFSLASWSRWIRFGQTVESGSKTNCSGTIVARDAPKELWDSGWRGAFAPFSGVFDSLYATTGAGVVQRNRLP